MTQDRSGGHAAAFRGRIGWLIGALVCGLSAALPASAAGYRTANFIVDAPTEALARRIGDASEQYRHSLAV